MTINGPFIRPAALDDSAALMRMAAAYFEEAGFDYPIDIASVARSIALLAQDGTMLVVDRNGLAVGMAAAVVHSAFFNHQVRLARELFWYVEPAHRRGIGPRLLEALEVMLVERGVTLFDAIAEAGERSIGLSRLLRAGGFSPAEQTFRKRLAVVHTNGVG